MHDTSYVRGESNSESLGTVVNDVPNDMVGIEGQADRTSVDSHPDLERLANASPASFGSDVYNQSTGPCPSPTDTDIMSCPTQAKWMCQTGARIVDTHQPCGKQTIYLQGAGDQWTFNGQSVISVQHNLTWLICDQLLPLIVLANDDYHQLNHFLSRHGKGGTLICRASHFLDVIDTYADQFPKSKYHSIRQTTYHFGMHYCRWLPWYLGGRSEIVHVRGERIILDRWTQASQFQYLAETYIYIGGTAPELMQRHNLPWSYSDLDSDDVGTPDVIAAMVPNYRGLIRESLEQYAGRIQIAETLVREHTSGHACHQLHTLLQARTYSIYRLPNCPDEYCVRIYPHPHFIAFSYRKSDSVAKTRAISWSDVFKLCRKDQLIEPLLSHALTTINSLDQ